MATAYIRPSADVSLNHTTSSGSTGYNLINEVVQDGDATTISISAYNTTTNKASTFTCTGEINPGHRITAAKAVVCARIDSSSASNSTVAIAVGSSSSSQDVSSTSYTNYTYTLTAADITLSGSAASANISITSNLTSGSKSTYNQYITQVYIELTTEEIPVVSKGYLKSSGSWLNKKAYQKVNGTWVLLSTAPSGWTANMDIRGIKYPFLFNKAFNKDVTSGPVDAENWLVSDFIAVTPDVECLVQGQGSNLSNTLFFAYGSDKSYYDYWGGTGEQVATVDGTIVYKRTMSAANMANTYYVRVNAKVLAMNYVKVWQNGVLLFDGSQYPIN